MATSRKIELFALALGFVSGVCTASFDYFVFNNEKVPAQQLNLDFIYSVFFLVAFLAYLFQIRFFTTRYIFFGTTFYLLAHLFGFFLLFVLVPSSGYMPRFNTLFPGRAFIDAMIEVAVARLTWSFIAMLLALVTVALRRRNASHA